MYAIIFEQIGTELQRSWVHLLLQSVYKNETAKWFS